MDVLNVRTCTLEIHTPLIISSVRFAIIFVLRLD